MSTVTAARRLRVAYVALSLEPGGTEKLVVEMSRALQADFDVEVICLDVPGTWAQELRDAGVAVHCLWRQPGLDLSVPVRLARHLRRSGADIVHAHQCTPWFYAALARLVRPRTRLLLEEHGRFHPETDNPRRRFVNRLAIVPLTHRFVAVSADIRARLQRYEGIPGAKIEVVYNGVIPEAGMDGAPRAELRRQLGIGGNDFVVGTVGRFDPIKNLDMLVDALHGAMAADVRIRGLLVGAGPESGRISARIAELGLAGRIVLPGYRADARRLVQCMDLFVQSSFSEGTSMALLEAMAVGVPVAVTAVGGNPEIVQDGRTGWLVPSGAVQRLREVIHEACADPHRLGALGAAGRQEFRTRFTFASMIDRYRCIYKEMVPGSSAA